MQNPRRLHEARRTDDDDGVAAPLAAGFEQQRDVERDQRPALARAAAQKPGGHQLDARMHDGFEPTQRRRVAENATAEFGAVDRAIADDAGKHRANGPDRRAVVAQQTMYLGIGIVNGNAEPAQPLGGHGLAHADRSGEPEYDHPSPGHQFVQPGASSTKRRSSGVTAGSTPNQAAKPGRA